MLEPHDLPHLLQQFELGIGNNPIPHGTLPRRVCIIWRHFLLDHFGARDVSLKRAIIKLRLNSRFVKQYQVI